MFLTVRALDGLETPFRRHLQNIWQLTLPLTEK